MSTWSSLYGSSGEYISPMFDISSNFDYYLTNITTDYLNNDGVVEVEVRTSHDDGITWGDWYSLNGVYQSPFDGDGIRMSKSKLQFKIIMDLTSNIRGVSPIFNQINIILIGAYKIENTGDVDCLPEMWLKKNNQSGTVNITNETTGQIITISDLNRDETVYIDNERKDIKSDLPLTYRYSNHNRQWLRLQDGENIITGTGDFTLEVRHEFKTLQG